MRLRTVHAPCRRQRVDASERQRDDVRQDGASRHSQWCPNSQPLSSTSARILVRGMSRGLAVVAVAIVLCVSSSLSTAAAAAASLEERVLALEAALDAYSTVISDLQRRLAVCEGDARHGSFRGSANAEYPGADGGDGQGEAERAGQRQGLRSSESAPLPCGCNTFNASVVTVTGDATGAAELVIGTPETGVINGVNIVALDNSAVKASGDQVRRWRRLCACWVVLGLAVRPSSPALCRLNVTRCMHGCDRVSTAFVCRLTSVSSAYCVSCVSRESRAT